MQKPCVSTIRKVFAFPEVTASSRRDPVSNRRHANKGTGACLPARRPCRDRRSVSCAESVSKKNFAVSFRIPDFFDRFVDGGDGNPAPGGENSTKTQAYGTIHFGIGSGNEQLPCDRIRPQRADSLGRAARIHPAVSQTGMGRAQSARDMVVAGVGHRRSDRRNRHQRTEHRGHRHHQPARNHDRMGCGDRRAGLQRHRLAGPPDLGVLRPAESRRQNRIHP